MIKSYLKIFFVFSIATVIFFSTTPPLLADMHGYLDRDGHWLFNNSCNNIKKYDEIIKQVAEKFEVESSLIIAIIKAESNFNHKAVSRKGAKGLMQIMPETASDLNLEKPFSPKENIIAGTRYISILLERFNHNKMLALAAYNAGPETVEAYRGVPPFPETKKFIHNVLYYYEQYSHLD
jgi:soluble lytic murein transglycosylase-like protein